MSIYHGAFRRRNPFAVVANMGTPWGAGVTIGEGNLYARHSRQAHYLAARPQLQVATHKRKPPSKPLNRKNTVVSVPMVSSRRTKNYSQKKILTTNKAMPYRRTYRRKPIKGGRSRRRRIRKLPPLTIPRSRVVRFRVCASSSLTATAGAIGTVMFKANSLNDPLGTFGQGLPLGLDQWAALYEKYIVLGSKITVKPHPTTQTGAGAFGVHLADNNTALTLYTHYREMPLTHYRLLTTQKDLATVTMKYAGKRFWKLSNIKDDSEQEATFSTTPGDPTDLAYYHVFAQDINGGNTLTCDVYVEIEFIVLLTNPVQLAQSTL